MSAYRRDLDKTNDLSFLIKYKKLLQKMMKFGKKSATLSKKNLAATLYTKKKKHIKAKIKSYNGKINTNLHNNKISKEKYQYICLSVILIDSVYKSKKNSSVFRSCNCAQVFLEDVIMF